MRKVKSIKTWNQMKLLESPMRKKILDACALAPSSIKELSDKFDLNPGSVFNHVRRLEQAGYLNAQDGRVINGIQEKKYSMSADSFDFSRLPKTEMPKRNDSIAKSFRKDVIHLLSQDRKATARRVEVFLSDDAHQKMMKLWTDLHEFLLQNKQSGQRRTLVVFATGKLED